MKVPVADRSLDFVLPRVGRLLGWLEPLILKDQRPLPGFELCKLDAPVHGIDRLSFSGTRVEPESYWGEWCMNFALRCQFHWPTDWDEAEIYLPLGVTGDIFSHPECLVYLNGNRLGSADRHHHRVKVSRTELGSDGHCELVLTGWTGLSGWPHDPTSKLQLFMRTCALTRPHYRLERLCGLFRLCLETAEQGIQTQAIQRALNAAVGELDLMDPLDDGRLDDSLARAEQRLRNDLSQIPSLEVTLHGIGHAHMDLAYLWTTEQTRAKVGRTFSNVLKLMQEFPDYRFTQSQPQLYQWAEQDYPDLFLQIQQQVAQGRWELTGGMWVEPDCNIPSGESLVRQLLWGRRYYQQHFDCPETPVLFLPDTFGFNAQLPQLMRLSGLKYFMTNKTNWNQFNPLPYQTFSWQGLDGSRVLAQTFTTPRAVQYLAHPTTYKAELSAKEVCGTWTNYQQQSASTELPIAYGYGDGGGGPNRPMLSRLDELSSWPGLPQVKPSTLAQFFASIEQTDWPVIQGELYLELHRGTYTSQAAIKQANRSIEKRLHTLEWLAAEVLKQGGAVPKDLMNQAWQTLLLNQFHDILPGTAIAEVFEEAHQGYEEAERALDECERLLTAQLFPETGLTLINDQPYTLRFARVPNGWTTESANAQASGSHQLLDVSLPAYSSMALVPGEASAAPAQVFVEPKAGGFELRNSQCTFTLTAEGWIQDWLLADGRAVLADGSRANELWAFDDRPICWDAWDIDPFFEDHACLIDTQATLTLIEAGPLEVVIGIQRTWKSSQIVQTLRLKADSDIIEIDNDIDWQQSNTLLKVSMPTAVASDTARYEIQFGSIERPAHRNDEHGAARFEVPAQRWGCLFDSDISAGILNDCKYGYDSNNGVMRLTLIKSSTSPAPEADRGRHQFRYGMVAYAGDWRGMPKRSRQFADPIQVMNGAGPELTAAISDVPENVVLETIKPAEDQNAVVYRFYEGYGQAVSSDWLPGETVDLLEKPTTPGEAIKPFEIVSKLISVGK